MFSAANHTVRRLGMRVSGNWGWEQSCYHHYLYEQHSGRLPDHCPKLVLDYTADLALNLVKATPALVLSWRRGERPRINDSVLPSLRGVRPCVLHANSAAKSLMPVLQAFWWQTLGPIPNAPPVGAPVPMPTVRDLIAMAKNESWKQAAPCSKSNAGVCWKLMKNMVRTHVGLRSV